MALEMVPHLSGSGRLQIINQPRYIQCRVDTDKKMAMVLFTPEFFQSAIPAFQNTSERGFKKAHDLRTDYLTTVFGDKVLPLIILRSRRQTSKRQLRARLSGRNASLENRKALQTGERQPRRSVATTLRFPIYAMTLRTRPVRTLWRRLELFWYSRTLASKT